MRKDKTKDRRNDGVYKERGRGGKENVTFEEECLWYTPVWCVNQYLLTVHLGMC